MSAKGFAAKLPNGLTPKQDKFVKHIIENVSNDGVMNITQAALDIYDTDSKKTAAAIASENLNKPVVKEAIETALSRAGLTRQVLTDRLAEIINAPVKEITGDTKLRAVVEGFKLAGAYPNQSKTVLGHSVSLTFQTVNFNEAKEQLKTLDSELSEFIDINE